MNPVIMMTMNHDANIVKVNSKLRFSNCPWCGSTKKDKSAGQFNDEFECGTGNTFHFRKTRKGYEYRWYIRCRIRK